MKDKHYSASFTAGALLYEEIRSVISILKQDNYIELLDKERIENNLLRIKTEGARIRITTEIKKRAKSVNRELWDFFESCSIDEQKLLLFYVLLNSSALARDYHFEVTLKKWRKYDYELTKKDIEMRLDELSSFDEEVASWSESTKTKTVTRYINALRDSGLLSQNRLIKANIFNDNFWAEFLYRGDSWFLEACFLSKTEIEDLK